MLFRFTLLIVFFLLLGFFSSAQEVNDQLIEQLVESMADELAEDTDYTDLLERLSFYQQHPIDLNKTEGKDLSELQFLSPLQIASIIQHRKISGDYMTVHELQTVDGLDLETVRLLLHFVKVDGTSSLKRLSLNEGKHDLLIRHARVLQTQQGYHIMDTTRSRYLGSPDRLFVRYRYQLKQRVQFSFNMEKDAGEQFFAGAQRYGFDFYSGSLQVKDQKRLKQLVVGDYSLQFGQGLALWTGLSFGKGALVQHVARQGMGLRPYTSTNEFLFFRGLAATYLMKNIAITPFFSYRKLSASFQGNEEGKHLYSSLLESGLHRTPTEVANRHSVRQLVWGANMQYQKNGLTVGGTYYQTQFDGLLSPRPLLYNKYKFTGDHLRNTSVYYNYNLSNMYLFGELAHSLGSGIAYTNGMIATLSHELSLVLHQRNYQKDYHSFFTQALAEGSNTENEHGFYSGLIFQPNRKLQLVTYGDYFKFPWLKYRVDAPSDGLDLFSQFTFSPNRSTKILARYRYRKKSENDDIATTSLVLQEVKRQQIRLELQHKVHASLALRHRAEFIHYAKHQKKEKGIMLYQDILYKPLKGKVSGNFRLALFNTSGFNSRIYAYENDVLYASSFPFYSNKGARYYANVRYKFKRGIDFWCRYASFIYPDLTQIGTGLERIDGKYKSELKLQMRCQF